MRHSSFPALFARSTAIFALVLLGLLLAPRTLLAQSIVRGNTVPAGEVIDNDVVLYGDEVLLSGTIKGNAFVSGGDIVVDGHIEGSLFAIGRRITINGAVDGSAYTLAVTSRLGSNGTIGQNFYFIGVSLVTERGSQIGRDLVGLTLGAILQGSVGRETRLIAGLVQFINLFFDFTVGPMPGPIRTVVTGRAPGLGQFILPGGVVVDAVGQTVDSTQAAQPDDQPDGPTGDPTADWFIARLREFLPLLIVGLLGYWFLRGRLEDAATVIKTRPLPALGLGLIGLVLAAATVGAFILVFVLILMTGIWIGRTTFWNVSWLLWSVAFPLAALAFALMMAFLNYGTKVITSYALMTFLIDRFAARAGRFRWLLMILGLVVYVFLRAIPTLGWVLSVVVTAWGIGAAWLAWRARRAAPPTLPPVVEASAPGADLPAVTATKDA